MMDLVKPDTLERSLRSDVCPMCGEEKRQNIALCDHCVGALPNQIAFGFSIMDPPRYAENMRQAMLHLRCTIFRLMPRKHAALSMQHELNTQAAYTRGVLARHG